MRFLHASGIVASRGRQGIGALRAAFVTTALGRAPEAFAGFPPFLSHCNTYDRSVLQCTKRIAAMRNFRLHRSLGRSYLPLEATDLTPSPRNSD